jgi:hypothetical protein
MARHVTRLAARHRLLRLAQACTPRVWVPRDDARLVARLVVDYFAYAARPGASARRAAHRVAHRRLVRLAQARTPRVRVPRPVAWLVVDYFATPHVRVPRHIARLVTRLVVDYFALRRLVVDYFASRRLVRHASRCLGMTRGSSRGSSSTTSPTPRVRVPRHVARLVSPLVVGYFT